MGPPQNVKEALERGDAKALKAIRAAAARTRQKNLDEKKRLEEEALNAAKKLRERHEAEEALYQEGIAQREAEIEPDTEAA